MKLGLSACLFCVFDVNCNLQDALDWNITRSTFQKKHNLFSRNSNSQARIFLHHHALYLSILLSKESADKNNDLCHFTNLVSLQTALVLD